VQRMLSRLWKTLQSSRTRVPILFLRHRLLILFATGILFVIAGLYAKNTWGGELLLAPQGRLSLSYDDRELLWTLSQYYQNMAAMNAGLAVGTLAAAFALAGRLRSARDRRFAFVLYFLALSVFGVSMINYSVYSTFHYRLIDMSLDLSGFRNVTIPGFEIIASEQLGSTGAAFRFVQLLLFKEGWFYFGVPMVVWLLFIVTPLYAFDEDASPNASRTVQEPQL